MRYILFCTALILGFFGGLKLSAQEIKRYNATAENGYGVVYVLPTTEIKVSALVVEREITKGELSQWSNKFLGYEAEGKPGKQYELKELNLKVVGKADNERKYLVAFERKSIAPYLRLAEGGILFSINGTEEPKAIEDASLPDPQIPDRAMPALPREYSLATTPYKRAEIVASYIYDLRDQTLGVVSGEAENMPKDGEAMRLALSHMRREEHRALRLFVGDTTVRTHRYEWTVVPEGDDMNAHTIFRFSPESGVVEASDSQGKPVVLDLKVLERAPTLDEKEQKKQDKLEGIAYYQPGLAEVRISLESKELTKARLPLTQLGTIQYLAKRMLNLKEGATTAIYFDPITGALREVRNE